MKSKDLMLGNYLLVNGIPRKICYIYDDGVKIGFKVPTIKNVTYARLSECKPIVVNVELLKRLGIKKKHGYKNSVPGIDYNIAIEIEDSGSKTLHFEYEGSSIRLRNFEYLHQFQNAISILGVGWELFILDEMTPEYTVSENELVGVKKFTGSNANYWTFDG